jgi:hypothetical protein
MRLTYEETLFIIRALSAAHGSNNPHDSSSNRRHAADLIDRLGAEALVQFQVSPDFSVNHISEQLRNLADRVDNELL